VSAEEKQTQVKVAVVQAGAVPFASEACVDKAVRLIGDAAAAGARVIVFPEAFIGGYPKGLNYGLVVGALPDAKNSGFIWRPQSTSRGRRPRGWPRRRPRIRATL